MRTSTLSLVAVVSLAFAPAPLPRPVSSAVDLERMQGTWLLVQDRRNGPPAHLPALQAVVTRGRLTFLLDGKVSDSWVITASPATKAKALDLSRDEALSPNRILAVYALEGDTLILCWNSGNWLIRPRSVSGAFPAARSMTFKRQKR